jgi:MFS family permease
MKSRILVNRVVQILLVFLFLLNVSGGLFSPLYAVFVTHFVAGATLATVGFSVALGAIAKSVLQIPLARKIDAKKGERDDFYVMLAGAVLSVIYPLGLIFISFPWQLYVWETLNGAASACLMAAYYALFSRHIDKGGEGFEWSLFSVWGLTVSSALGGAVGGVIADAIGFHLTFIISSALGFVATLFLIFLYPLLDGWKKKAGLKIPMP